MNLSFRVFLVVFAVLVLPPAAFADDAAGGKAEAKPATGGAKGKKEKAPLVDINTATEDELKAIPGIGDAYAKKIIEGRPYARKDELLKKKVLPGKVYSKVQKRIIAKQGETAK